MWPVPDRYNAAADFIDRHIEEGRGSNIAIYYKDQEINYQEVYQQVNRAGRLLQELGVEMEQRVFICLPDGPEFIYLFFGAVKIGAVPVPLNTRLRPQDYVYFINDGRPKVIVNDANTAQLFQSIEHEFTRVPRKPIFITVNGGELPEGWIDFHQAVEHMESALEPADTHKDDIALWLYSSGSTGSPKGTIHLQHDMAFEFEHYGKGILNAVPEDRFFSVAKLHFAFGLGNSMYHPFGAGASTVLVPDLMTPEVILQTIDRYKPTLFFTVPTAYNAMLRHENRSAYDVSSLRLSASAGEPSSPKLIREWIEWAKTEMLDTLGSTEALHTLICNRPGKVRPGSSGMVLPGFEAKIVDEEGRPVKTGEVGDLYVKGDSIAAGYWNKHEKTQETFMGPWLRTGDKYSCDEDGYYWYEGRSDDMIKSGGLWVSPIEVENVLIEHPAIVECAVVAYDSGDGLMKPMAYIVSDTETALSEQLTEELRGFVKQKLAGYKCPHQFEFIKDLPKTSTGKILRYKLRELNNRGQKVV